MIITNNNVIFYLDQLRKKQKLTILQLTKGITSSRNYHRYLSGETNPTFIHLSKMLNRLCVTLYDFYIYVHNSIERDNAIETEFYDAVKDGKYDYAYKKIYSQIKGKNLKTVFAEKTIPCQICFMKYKLGLMNDTQTILEMKKVINIKELVNNSIIDDDLISSLYVYVQICPDKEKNIIGNYLADLIITNDYVQLMHYYQWTTMIMHITALSALTTIKENQPCNYKKIQQITSSALEFNYRANLKILDTMLFRILYDFTKRNKKPNKYL
ncbi:MAG: helix-turn-helix transcriptional regulator, partial [Bacilli bacterium]